MDQSDGDMQEAGRHQSRDSELEDPNGHQIEGDQQRVDEQTHITVCRREAPASDNEGGSGFKPVVMAGPMGHPGTCAKAKEERDDVSLELLFHALFSPTWLPKYVVW